MLRRIVLWLLLFRLPAVYAQDNPYIFSHLTEANGLSDNVVNCFLKDHRGILWVGTYDGFSRFDGSNFFSYKIRKGSNSMINEVVHSLCEDKLGNLWGATNDGVFCYKPRLDSFINYQMQSMGRPSDFLNTLCDKKGNVWVSGAWSVFRFNAAQNRFDETIRFSENADSARKYYINKNGMREDPSGKGLWLTTISGLVFYDFTTGKLSDQRNQPGNPLFASSNLSALGLSANNQFWMFDNTTKDIIRFDPATRQITQRINIRENMPRAWGATLFEDKQQRLWFSSWSYELLVIDLAHGNTITQLEHKPADRRSVAGQFFWSGYQDEDNTIWLGTVAGISRCNPERNIYTEYRLHELIPALKNSAIHRLAENPADQTFWLSTIAGDLVHFNPLTNQYKSYKLSDAIPAPDQTLPGFVNRICFVNGAVIVNTHQGSWQLDKGAARLQPFTLLPAGYEDFTCAETIFTGDSVAWYNNGQAILYWNRRSNFARLSVPDSTDHTPTSLGGITEGINGELWMYTDAGGLAVVHRSGRIELIPIQNDALNRSGAIVSLGVDKSGKVWILNKGVGLYIYDPAKRTTAIRNETDGLVGSRIHQLALDTAGRVWSMLYNKVSVFIPGTEKFYNFTIPFSESNLNYYNYLYRRSNGHVVGTINNAIMEFFPERLMSMPAIRKPQISQVNISGKDFFLTDGDKTDLRPDQNTIRFRFGSTIYREIFPYEIEYMLEGAETNWTVASDLHEALYNNLPSGEYVFRVRVKGKNIAWTSEEATVRFKIHTPFYKAKWFLVLLVLLLSGLVYLVYRFRIAQKEKLLLLENKAQALEKEKALVMYENLKQQLNPHFLFNSLTSLNSLIEEEPAAASEFLDNLSKSYRYILKSRDHETVPLADEIRFAENYIKLQQTRFEKGLDIRLTVPEEYHHKLIVPVTLQNLIENAIKHNIIDEDQPLLIKIFIENGRLVVQNNLQKKKMVETSNRVGLSNMQSLYQYLSREPVEIIETAESFTVKLPLL